MFGGVRRARKAGGTFVGAAAVIDHRGDDRSERVMDDDDLQAVGECGAEGVVGAEWSRQDPCGERDDCDGWQQ